MPLPRLGYPVRVTITEVKGNPCTQGFKVGDTWLIDRNQTPARFCLNAFCQVVYPIVRTFRYGGEHPWDKDKDVTHVTCPDQTRQVVYEVRRLRE